MILRHILKHLRQRRLLGPYQSILSRTGLERGNMSQKFEHPSVSLLHNALVLQGLFPEAESLLSTCAEEGLFSSSILAFQPSALWSRINILGDPEGVTTQPSARGGHAMCIDKQAGHIYMFGGWDGKKSLQDFWLWSIHEMKWKFLGSDGPAPRACHKMVFDENTGDIYLFGRLDEKFSADLPPMTMSSGRPVPYRRPSPPESSYPTTTRSDSIENVDFPRDNSRPSTRSPNFGVPPTKPTVLCAEFYRYKTRGPSAGEWEQISFDTVVRKA